MDNEEIIQMDSMGLVEGKKMPMGVCIKSVSYCSDSFLFENSI